MVKIVHEGIIIVREVVIIVREVVIIVREVVIIVREVVIIVKSGSFMIIIKELRDPAVNLLHQRPVEKG